MPHTDIRPVERFFWILIVVIAVAVFYGAHTDVDARFDMRIGSVFEDFKNHSVLFVGDVMLARGVEMHMREHGYEYPFERIRTLMGEYDAVVGNLETAIPEGHVPTPVNTFQFSIPETFAEELTHAGFSMLSLANNHTGDFGEDGLRHTRTALRDAGVHTIGHPQHINETSSTIVALGRLRMSIIALNATWDEPDTASIIEVLEKAEEESDIQIVTIHWGEEYALMGNNAQRTLAHALIDNGADAIIGHHPHVVQHIEAYKGAPIFYSLGNFIFDQYWNDDVQNGLAVGVHVDGRAVTYRLIPVTSVDRASAPRLMDREERRAFLATLAARSDEGITSEVQNGTIVQTHRE